MPFLASLPSVKHFLQAVKFSVIAQIGCSSAEAERIMCSQSMPDNDNDIAMLLDGETNVSISDFCAQSTYPVINKRYSHGKLCHTS